MKYVLKLNTGRDRSKELRGTMLTEPASAAPCDSGVGENDTSTRERLLIEIWSRPTARFVPPAPPPTALATLKPSIVTGTLSAGTPLRSEERRVGKEGRSRWSA